MIKWILRSISIATLVVCAAWGFFLVQGFQGFEEVQGEVMLRLLYEYDTITDVYEREEQLRAQCTEEVWEQLSFGNDAHWQGTWGQTRNAVTKVRIVFSRPGIIIYALENDWVYPTTLRCFEYETQFGKFTSIREYQLVGTRRSKDGGFF